MDTHSLVAFDPQEEHALHLHVCGIYFMCEQLGLEQVYSWYPRILFLQLSSFVIVVTIEGLRLSLFFS